MSISIPLSIPNFEGNERKYVDDAIDQGWVSTGGAYITRLEKELARFLHVENVAACQSGTAALHLALVEAGVKPGDIVIVPPLTFIAAVNPIRYQFATPVFIDCDDSFCLDPIKFRLFCETKCQWDGSVLWFNGAQVKAVIVVHVFGNMADMETIMEIANTYNLKVIEDATEALGTYYSEGKYAGKFAGTIGHFGAFSFNGNKIITTGGGGAITANNPVIVDHLRYLSTQAKNDPHFYIHNEVGFNYRMTNIQAALGVAQMEELPVFLNRKRRNYEIYKKQLSGFKYGVLMPFREGVVSNKWLYSLKINRDYIKASMREIIGALQDKGIETRAIWGLINEQKPYIGEVSFQLEKAPYYAGCILNIPSSTQIKEEEICYVVEQLKAILMNYSEGGSC